MFIKDRLKLINTVNIFDFPQSTIDPVKVSSDDLEIFISTLKLIAPKLKDSPTKKYVDFHIDSSAKYLDIVKIKKYQLVSAYNIQTRRGLININSLATRDISNINPRDLYALTVYMHTCSLFSSKSVDIPADYASAFADYYTSFLLNSFSKKYGLTGSYQDLIPPFKFLSFLYVYRSFFGINQNIAASEISRLTRVDPSRISLDFSKYDFVEINDYLKALNDSQIMPGLSPYRFLDSMIRLFGIINLGFFEDSMRFASTMFASSVEGNTIFPMTIQMVNPQQYRKVNDIIDFVLKKTI